MANINCPFIGKWADSGSITSLSFNTDGTIDTNAGTNQFSFLVWEINSDHKLVTLDDTGAASATPVVYDFTLNGNSLTLSGSVPLNGNYTGTPTPAPLSMDNELLGIWTADVTGRDMVEGDWGFFTHRTVLLRCSTRWTRLSVSATTSSQMSIWCVW
ncbi:MAG: hypothetical protein MdMp014T_2641 [Treponematales bacterium]